MSNHCTHIFKWVSFLLFIIYVQNPVLGQDKLKIFLNCSQEWLCDGTYLRNELKVVDYVRDRFLCDVQIIVNTNFTNGGGESTMMIFLGQKEFSNRQDTFSYFNEATATEDIKRQRMVKFMKIGLIPYINKTKLMDNIEINFKDENSIDKSNDKSSDKWNLWQFTLGVSGFFNGDNNYLSNDVNTNLSANRETEKSNFSFFANNNISRNKYTFYQRNASGDIDTSIIKATRDRQNMQLNYTIKMNEHWAYGIQSRYRRSVVENIDSRNRAIAVVEYSIFPYKAFNNKRIVLEYNIGPEFSRYADTTIFLKKQELLARQSLALTTSFTQKWGSLNLGFLFDHYLHDFSKNNLFIGGGLSWNVAKGLRFSVGGNIEFQRNQLSIPKADASLEDVLTQRRIIASSYSYWGGVGFSYTFGSIFNSQVHQAFRGLNYSLNF